MAFKDVMALRKEGKVDEALALARADVQNNRDKWSCNALFWALRDKCRQLLQAGDITLAQPLITQMEQLLPELDDTDEVARKSLNALKYATVPHLKELLEARDLARDPGTAAQAFATVDAIVNASPDAVPLGRTRQAMAGWIIIDYLKHGMDTLPAASLKKALATYLKLDRVERPGALHSQALYQALALKAKHPDQFDFDKFMLLWGPDNFTLEDWQGRTDEQGKHYASMAQRAVTRQVADRRSPDKDRPLGPELEAMVERVVKADPAGTDHLKRQLAIEYRLTGRTAKALAAYKRLALTMGNHDYVWRELAALLPDGPEQAGALCKALLLNHADRYSAGTRIKLAALLIAAGDHAAALAELNHARRVLESDGRQPGQRFSSLMAQIPAGTVAAGDNRPLYARLAQHIDAAVTAAQPVAQGVVTLRTNRRGEPYAIVGDCYLSKKLLAGIPGGATVAVRYVEQGGKRRAVSVTLVPQP